MIPRTRFTAWRDSGGSRRDSPTIRTIAQAIDLTADTLDALFGLT